MHNSSHTTSLDTVWSLDSAVHTIAGLYSSARNLESNREIHEYLLFPRNFWPLGAIIATYLLMATVIGPKAMANRRPFELRTPIFVYNVFMVTINIYFFVQSLVVYEFGAALLNFEYPNNHKELSPTERRRLVFVYWYFLSKLVDLLDTLFFILRKKWSQVTPLHLYHHSSVPMCVWLACEFAPIAGVNGIFPIFNSAVHVLMYTYYALSSFGPAIQKYLWWKRYITQVQLGQFVIFFVYAVTYVFKQTGWPSILILTSVAQPPLYIFMFTSFYVNTYCAKSAPKKVN